MNIGRDPLYLMWMEMQDVIGKSSLWPYRVRAAFWSRNPTHFERFLMVIFCWVNGLSPDILLQWLLYRRVCVEGDSRFQHIKAVFEFLSNGRGNHYYAYNVSMNRYEYMNGRIRHYNKRN